MKTKTIIIVILFFITKLSFGQDWMWAKQIGGPNSDGGGVMLDANNNMYCSGIFFGSCYFENDTLLSLGVNDIFIAKFDDNGHKLWTKRIGGNNPYNTSEYGGVAAIDNNNGCLYFKGKFYNTLTIDSHTVTSSGGSDIFLTKFDLSGNCLWLKKVGSSDDDEDKALCLDVNGNIYFTGQITGANGTFDTISLSAGTFLSKLDPNGNILWAHNVISGGSPITSPTMLKIIYNQIFMSGVAGNNTIIIGTIPLISTNQVDGFIAKLDLNGNCLKAKRFGGHLPNYAINFETDTNINIYVTGFFSDTLTIDGATLTTNNSNHDMFFCKFDSAFNLVWIRQSYSTGAYGALAYGMVKDSESKFYVSGFFSGNATFGIFNVSSPVTKDMFIVKYDTSGNCIGVRHFGEAEAGNINLDSNSDLIVAGNFINTVNIGSTTLTSHGSTDMFFAKATPITGISEVRKTVNNSLIIYANPTTGKCNITVPDDFLNENNLILSIFDNSGKIIQQKKLEMSENKIKLDLEAEAKGIYTAVLSNGKKSYTGKIVFE